MNTLITRTDYCDVLINLDNVTYIERAVDKESIIYFKDKSHIRVMEDFYTLEERLHGNK